VVGVGAGDGAGVVGVGPGDGAGVVGVGPGEGGVGGAPPSVLQSLHPESDIPELADHLRTPEYVPFGGTSLQEYPTPLRVSWSPGTVANPSTTRGTESSTAVQESPVA